VGMTTMEIITRPWTMTVPWLAVLGAGWPAFWLWKKLAPAEPPR
jgi:hypothetical protein